MATVATHLDTRTIKEKQQATWASGDYAVIGVTLQMVGESLCEAVDLRSGERVLDVAAGNGNATLAAARRFGRVTSTDYVAHLLAAGRRRADAEGQDVHFQTADAEALPFADGSFDVVLSVFGVMFAPDQEEAARELLRVSRPGGRIGLASWTPDGFIGELFRVVGRHVPPPPGLRSAALWGTRPRLEELFRPEAAAIDLTERDHTFRYLSASHWIEIFRTWYGPVHRAFMALDEAGQQALEADLITLLERRDRGSGGGLVIDGRYAEVVITRK